MRTAYTYGRAYARQLLRATDLSFLGLANPSNRLDGDTVGRSSDFEDVDATTKKNLNNGRSTE